MIPRTDGLELRESGDASEGTPPDASVVVKPSRHGRLAAITALAVLAGAESMGYAPPQPFPDTSRRKSFTEREGLDRQWDASEKAQFAKIAAANAKRERKALKRRSVR